MRDEVNHSAPSMAAVACLAVFACRTGQLVLVSDAFLSQFDVPPTLVCAKTTWQHLLGGAALEEGPAQTERHPLVDYSIAAIHTAISALGGGADSTVTLPALCLVTANARVVVRLRPYSTGLFPNAHTVLLPQTSELCARVGGISNPL